MNLQITQTTNVKIGKKSLSQVQGLFLAMMDAISKGDAKDMFSSIENLRNAVDEKQPVVKRVAPFTVVLEDLVNMVENSTNPKARAYKIAKIKELISSLEEDAVKHTEAIISARFVPNNEEGGLIPMATILTYLRSEGITITHSELNLLLREMGFLFGCAQLPVGLMVYAKELVSEDDAELDTVDSARLGTAVRKLFEPHFENPINTHTIWVAISTFMGENVDVKTLDAILMGMGYLHSTDKDNGNFYCIALKPNYQYLLPPEYVPSEGDVNIQMKDN